MLTRGELDREAVGQEQAKDVLHVVRHPWRVAPTPRAVDFEFVFLAPIGKVVSAGVESGFLFYLAPRGFAQCLARITAPRHRLPKPRPICALEQQDSDIGSVY